MSISDEKVSDIIDRMEALTVKRRALDEAPFGVTIADMRQEDDPLIYANAGFENITGYDTSEILGRNCRFLQGEDTDSEPVTAMRTAIGNGESVQVELRNYRKDGSMFWSEVTLAPIESEEGRITHYVGFQQDVTKRKEYEQQLEEQRDDLTILNEMVRHDIRNDLQVALASMEVLRVNSSGADDEQITTAIESVNQAIGLTNTARDIADVMLDTDASYEPIDLGLILETELRDIEATYPELTVDVPGTIPQVRIEANELLSSVFRNILVNAAEHSHNDTQEVRVASWVADGDVFVTISDTGPGIPAADTDAIFEKGWTGTDSSGTGIGLFIVHRLVQNYGGDISVIDSDASPAWFDEDAIEPLDGATFVVRVPIVA